MALIPWRERHPLTELREEIDNIFDNFFGRGKKQELEGWKGPGLRSPAVDMEETDKEIIVKAELPGLDPKDFQISLTENTLMIKGEKKEEKEEKKKNYHMIERRYGSFYRSIPLPCSVETDKVEANYEKGILEITLPKSELVKAKQITVNVK
ncbi:MAG: Hsp20/alpha crystallin family protein [bacterium]|nr:MAG: Hsp20/alpha crystallin family protein [bacterium]